jgi:hypothetical protein
MQELRKERRVAAKVTLIKKVINQRFYATYFDIFSGVDDCSDVEPENENKVDSCPCPSNEIKSDKENEDHREGESRIDL